MKKLKTGDRVQLMIPCCVITSEGYKSLDSETDRVAIQPMTDDQETRREMVLWWVKRDEVALFDDRGWREIAADMLREGRDAEAQRLISQRSPIASEYIAMLQSYFASWEATSSPDSDHEAAVAATAIARQRLRELHQARFKTPVAYPPGMLIRANGVYVVSLEGVTVSLTNTNNHDVTLTASVRRYGP